MWEGLKPLGCEYTPRSGFPPPVFPSRVDGPPCFSGGRVVGASFFHLRQELSPGWLQWYYAGGVLRGHPGALSSEIRRCTSGAPPCVSETVEVVRQGPETRGRTTLSDPATY